MTKLQFCTLDDLAGVAKAPKPRKRAPQLPSHLKFTGLVRTPSDLPPLSPTPDAGIEGLCFHSEVYRGTRIYLFHHRSGGIATRLGVTRWLKWKRNHVKYLARFPNQETALLRAREHLDDIIANTELEI